VCPHVSLTLHRGSGVSAVAECLAGYIREGFGPEIKPPVPVVERDLAIL